MIEIKKLLILGGAYQHIKVVTAAKSLGVYVIVTDNLSPEEAPAKKYADEYWMNDILDIKSIVEKCKEHQIDGVLSYCIDIAQIPYCKICRQLDLPCFGTLEQFEIMTNKSKFREFARLNNLGIVPEYTEEDVCDGKVEFPVIVKPSESRGSRGISLCRNVEEFLVAKEIAIKESLDDKFLVEKDMSALQDFCLSYIVIDSIPYLIKIGDRYVGRKEDNLNRQQICTLLPSIYLPIYNKEFESNVVNFIKNLGIKFGAIFLQGFIENNGVYFYDPGLRFPGSDFDLSIITATNFDPMKTLVLYALSGDETSCYGNPVNAFKLNDGVCVILAIALRPGKIGDIKGTSILAKDSRILSLAIRYKVGDIVPGTGDIQQRGAEIVAYLQSRGHINEFIKSVYDIIKFYDEKGHDMIVSRIFRDVMIKE